jgi:methylmalonyl-CoA mutase N-terminal domain/subunit
MERRSRSKKEKVLDKMKGKGIKKRRFEGCPYTETSAGIPLKPIYTPEDIKEIDYKRELNEPGEYPFTRGIWKDMYRGKLWTRRVFSGIGSAIDTNKRYKDLINTGVTGLYLFPDQPSMLGIDPDHPMAEDYGGVSGTSCICLRDTKELYDGISFDDVSISTNFSMFSTPVFYASLVATMEERGYDLKNLSGSMINEPMYMSIAVYDFDPQTPFDPLDVAVKLSCDAIEYSLKHTPKWHPLAANPYGLHEKGANAIQEVAFQLSIMLSYINRLLERGLRIDDFVHRMNVIGCACDIDFFEEIAKFRAARRIWAKLMKEKYNALDEKSCRLYISVHTAGSSLTAAQPVNNIIRITMQSLACVLGGLQSFDPAGYDEAYCTLSKDAEMTSMNIHNILAYESRVASVADPLGGSYFMEWLTNKMEKEMQEIINQIEGMGGAMKALGWMRKEMEKNALREQREMDDKTRIIVGLNEFVVPKEEEVPIRIRMDRTIEEQMATAEKLGKRIRKIKEERDKKTVKDAMERLKSEASKGERHNLIPPIKDALRADATFGEILGVIRAANGYSYDPYKMIENPFE